MNKKNFNFKYQSNERGFVALLSTIILTIILMIVMFTTSMSTFFARFDSLGNENKKVSLALSDGCANAALLKIGQNYDYIGNEPVLIDTGKNCFINTIVYSPFDENTPISMKKIASIKTSAQYPSINGSWNTTTVTAVINNKSSSLSPSEKPISIISWN